jgi:hypothetical protein
MVIANKYLLDLIRRAMQHFVLVNISSRKGGKKGNLRHFSLPFFQETIEKNCCI